jgi:hypothetical protein
MSYQLILSGHYDRDPGLDKYLLALIDGERGHVNQWSCTSSHVNGQKQGQDQQKGGLIPPTYHCKGLLQYAVDLTPLDLTHQAGIRGSFYKITPFEVITLNGTKRGDFGIHLDANAPGSLGCIVMDWHNFKDFENQMSHLRKVDEVKRVSLHCFYS